MSEAFKKLDRRDVTKIFDTLNSGKVRTRADWYKLMDGTGEGMDTEARNTFNAAAEAWGWEVTIDHETWTEFKRDGESLTLAFNPIGQLIRVDHWNGEDRTWLDDDHTAEWLIDHARNLAHRPA